MGCASSTHRSRQASRPTGFERSASMPSRRESRLESRRPPTIEEGSRTISRGGDGTTAADLMHALTCLSLPLVRRSLCKSYFDAGAILRHEVRLETLDPDDLPLCPIRLHCEGVKVLDFESLKRDQRVWKSFEWPADTEEMMGAGRAGNPGEAELVVVDMFCVNIEVRFAEGIEFAFPLPSGVQLEIGCGGRVKNASIQIFAPQLRCWFNARQDSIKMAFMRKPTCETLLHANVDVLGCDFMGMIFRRSGWVGCACEP